MATRVGQLTAELQFFGGTQVDGSEAPTISTTKVKTGTYSYRFGILEDPIGLIVPSVLQIRAGYWLNHISITSVQKPILFNAVNADAEEYTIYWDGPSGNIQMYINEVQVANIAASGTLINRVDTWMHMGLSIKTGAGGFCSLYIDGVQTLSFSDDFSISPIVACYGTGQGSTSGGWPNYAYMDDFYVDETEGESDLPPFGKRFMYMAPTVQSSVEFTPVGDTTNLNCIDDGVPDEDTTYNKTLVTGNQDLYEMSDVTLPLDHVIRAVIPVAIARKSDAGTDARLKLQIYDGANLAESSAYPTNFAYNTLFERFTTQPDGSSWEEADANGMLIGYESAGGF